MVYPWQVRIFLELEMCRKVLEEQDALSADQDAAIQKAVTDAIEEAVEFATNSPDPDPSDVVADIYA